MNKIFLVVVLVAVPALADISLPRWGYASGSGGWIEGQIYKAERFEAKGHVGFEVEIRPLVCEPVVASNPNCTFEWANETSGPPPTVKIETSKFNGVHCRIENFRDLKIVDHSVRLWDESAQFVRNNILKHTRTTLVKGVKYRTSWYQVAVPSCLTYDEPLASEVPVASANP